MYSGGFVCCVLVDGKIAKEGKCGRTPLQFGSEYTIRLRNKNDRDAVAKVFIDGENVSGNGWIVRANSFEDIERQFNSPTKFKFVSQESDEAVDAGKNGDLSKKNGLIEVHWQLERAKPQVINNYMAPPKHWKDSPIQRGPISASAPHVYSYINPNLIRGMFTHGELPTMESSFCVSSMAPSTSMSCLSNSSKSIEGCTVNGSYSGQKVTTGYVGALEETAVVIILHLVPEEPLALPVQNVTTELKATLPGNFCPSCGYHHKQSKPNFCAGCGSKV